MFEETDAIEFINRIINSDNIKDEEIEINISKFYEYLALTKMCDNTTLVKISKIIKCLKEILTLKETLGYININNLLLDQKHQNPVKIPANRHYNHYETSSYSSSCGTSRTYTSRC